MAFVNAIWHVLGRSRALVQRLIEKLAAQEQKRLEAEVGREERLADSAKASKRSKVRHRAVMLE